MYAVVKTGGKQHRVRAGDVLRIEKLEGEVGQKITLDQVLMVGGGEAVKLGTPMVPGAKVQAEIVDHGLAQKVIVFKRRRRKHHKKLRGHRQPYTDVRVTGIEV